MTSFVSIDAYVLYLEEFRWKGSRIEIKQTTGVTNQSSQIGFGGGCHWCTEAVFSSLVGVSCVQQGFIRSQPPKDQYSEAVLIQYNEEKISLFKLIEIHLRTHASFSAHSMREKYRSAIYVENDAMAEKCEEVLNALQARFDEPLVTQVLESVKFKKSSESYTDYYATDRERPFCVTYIEPKLALLRREYNSYLKDEFKQAEDTAAEDSAAEDSAE